MFVDRNPDQFDPGAFSFFWSSMADYSINVVVHSEEYTRPGRPPVGTGNNTMLANLSKFQKLWSFCLVEYIFFPLLF